MAADNNRFGPQRKSPQNARSDRAKTIRAAVAGAARPVRDCAQQP
jgi:hypothetical protein